MQAETWNPFVFIEAFDHPGNILKSRRASNSQKQ